MRVLISLHYPFDHNSPNGWEVVSDDGFSLGWVYFYIFLDEASDTWNLSVLTVKISLTEALFLICEIGNDNNFLLEWFSHFLNYSKI